MEAFCDLIMFHVLTKRYKEQGGMQFDRKKERSKVNAEKLMKDYPDFVKINPCRKSGFWKYVC